MDIFINKWASSEKSKNKYYVLPYFDVKEKRDFIERQIEEIFKVIGENYELIKNDKYIIVKIDSSLIHDSKIDYITISLQELIDFADK
jgi:hypothetical protein